MDPVLGSPGSPQSWNRYAYAFNDPVNYFDPGGRSGAGAERRSFIRNPRARMVGSYFAAKLAEYAAANMQPGYGRAAANAAAAVLAFDSLVKATTVTIGGVVAVVDPIPDPSDVVTRVGGFAAIGLGGVFMAIDAKMVYDYGRQAWADFQVGRGAASASASASSFGVISDETTWLDCGGEFNEATGTVSGAQPCGGKTRTIVIGQTAGREGFSGGLPSLHEAPTGIEYTWEELLAIERFNEFASGSFWDLIQPGLRGGGGGGGSAFCDASCERQAF